MLTSFYIIPYYGEANFAHAITPRPVQNVSNILGRCLSMTGEDDIINTHNYLALKISGDEEVRYNSGRVFL